MSFPVLDSKTNIPLFIIIFLLRDPHFVEHITALECQFLQLYGLMCSVTILDVVV